MDSYTNSILEFLEREGVVGTGINIAPLLNGIFGNGDPEGSDYAGNALIISNLLRKINGELIDFPAEYLDQIEEIRRTREGWQVFNAQIRPEGVKALYTERQNIAKNQIKHLLKAKDHSPLTVDISSIEPINDPKLLLAQQTKRFKWIVAITIIVSMLGLIFFFYKLS